ncbi:CPBP family intramembrane glutamic endopeptidase [Microbacterium sp. A196]|uniref:lysostaphin resistance A-like protein n=1 Tax=unclassified Microbacterium TaxID=2609290 RepID=UPI003FD4C1C2
MTSSITPTLDKPGIVRRIFAFPPVWLVLGAAAIVIVYAVLTGVASEMSTPFQIAAALIGTAGSIGLYLLTMRVLARRRTPELRWAAGREFLLGGAVGAFFIIASVMIVAALGGYTVQWHPVDVFTTVMLAVAVNLGAAVIEELVFRGLALQVFEKYVGPWVAIAVTALLFGGAHMLNPGASLWSGFAITVEAGVLIGAAFVWRRNLWFAIGLHFVWNTVQSLFGIPVSGHRNPGLFETTVHGDDWLTGGGFGVEASVVSVGLSLVLSTLMIVAARRRIRAEGPIALAG